MHSIHFYPKLILPTAILQLMTRNNYSTILIMTSKNLHNSSSKVINNFNSKHIKLGWKFPPFKIEMWSRLKSMRYYPAFERIAVRLEKVYLSDILGFLFYLFFLDSRGFCRYTSFRSCLLKSREKEASSEKSRPVVRKTRRWGEL